MNVVVQPPWFYRALFPEALWRVNVAGRKVAYLTFDDGPVPEVTPWVLDTLDRYGVKATFFMVGDNARRSPQLLEEVIRRGHTVGNHTMHHLQGLHTDTRQYLRDVDEANALLGASLFRPPHGLLRWSQGKALKSNYVMVMYDVVTRDYSRRLFPEQVLSNVKRYTRPGSIIVFHDSLKAEANLKATLVPALEWLLSEGYELRQLVNP